MKLTTESIGYINLFESLTGAKLKDCFFDSDVLVFLVEEGNVKRAIGKDNSNIKKISHILKKRFKILAFSDDVCKFAANLIYPIKADEISLEDKTLMGSYPHDLYEEPSSRKFIHDVVSDPEELLKRLH